MSKTKYIISVRNLSKCEPDNLYYCGPASPVKDIHACVLPKEVLLDGASDAAAVFHSHEAAGIVYGLLKSLGFDGIQVSERTTALIQINSNYFEEMVKQNRIKAILATLETDDIKFLSSVKVLDLTIVT